MKRLRFPLFGKVFDYCYALRVIIVLAYVFITTNNVHIFTASIKNKRLKRIAIRHSWLLIVVFFPLIPLIFLALRIYLLMLRVLDGSLGFIERIYARIPWFNHRRDASRLEKWQSKTKEKFNQAKMFYERLAVKLRNNYTVYKNLVRFFNTHRKLHCVSMVMGCGALGTLFSSVIAVAWICEKLGLSLSLSHPRRNRVYNFFEHSVLNYSPVCRRENFSRLKEAITDTNRSVDLNFDFFNFMLAFANRNISSDYGYRVITALSIRPDLQRQVDTWWYANATGNCIGVHYRGTDMEGYRKITIDAYIAYLREVLDETSCILVCSDRAQFIPRMKTEFPGRVIARDIQRSYTETSLHFARGGPQQKQDAFMDMLALAKTQVIYTTGSYFVDCIRFFNPAVKIISLRDNACGKIGRRRISNSISIPKKDAAAKIRQKARAWGASYPSESDR